MKGNNRAKVDQFRSLVEPGVLPCTHIGHGVRVVLDWDYHRLAHAANRVIVDLTADYPRAARLYTALLTDPQTLASWDLTDYMAVEKLGYNDHGQMHAQVVAANALRLLDLLQTAGVTLAVIDSGAGTLEDTLWWCWRRPCCTT